VNIAWGIIDGTTVIYGGLTDKAGLERIISKLKNDRNNRELRDKVLDSIGNSSVDYLPDAEKEKIVDRIIDEAPEAPVKYHVSRDDRNTLIAIASRDILAVIPVILPYLFLGFGKTPMLSRLIASLAIGYIAFLYAEHIGRRKWLNCRHLCLVHYRRYANNLRFRLVTGLPDGFHSFSPPLVPFQQRGV
jgi:hypothetical protein